MTSLFSTGKPLGGFGSSTATTTAQPSLFGASTMTTTPATGGLFGASQPAQSTGLFGASTTQPGSTSLFGGAKTATPAQPAGSSLFGAPAQPAQPAQSSLFGQSQSQAPQNNFAGALSAGVGASTGAGALNAQAQKELIQARLQAAGLNSSTRERTVQQQVETLFNKWNPQSDQTPMQTYLYNAANPAIAPFYHPEFNEDERKYEEALAKKPEPVDGNSWVPVLTRGFQALGERVKYQAQFVQSMQARLHEMNNALDAIMQKHAQEITVRIDASRRQHAAISARALRLAVKCQILRNRGYALDRQEDGLRTTLLELEKKVHDPAFQSREEEIWARMVMLRERSRWLEEEGKRLGSSVNGQPTNNSEAIPKEVIDQARRILRDYNAQIQQLAKEINAVQQDFSEWQETGR